MSDDTIAIESREKFQQTITTLTDLQSKIASAAAVGKKVSETATTAAGKNVTTSGTGSDDKLASAYIPAVTSLGTAIEGVGTHTAAAGDSLASALSDLSALLQNLTGTDDAAAAAVKSA